MISMAKKVFPTVLDKGIDVASVIPYNLQKYPLNYALNSAFKELLAEGDLDFIEGKVISVHVKDKRLKLLITVQAGKMQTLAETSYDAQITASAEDFILIAARKVDPDTLFFQRRLTLEGDTDLGHGFKNTLDSIELDDLPLFLRMMIEKAANLVQVSDT